MSTSDSGRRQADYFRDVLRQELSETQQRVDHLARRMSDLIARDEAPITVKRTGMSVAMKKSPLVARWRSPVLAK